MSPHKLAIPGRPPASLYTHTHTFAGRVRYHWWVGKAAIRHDERETNEERGRGRERERSVGSAERRLGGKREKMEDRRRRRERTSEWYREKLCELNSRLAGAALSAPADSRRQQCVHSSPSRPRGHRHRRRQRAASPLHLSVVIPIPMNGDIATISGANIGGHLRRENH